MIVVDENAHDNSEHSFSLNGLQFLLSTTDYSRKTKDDQIILLKPPEWIEFYRNLLSGGRVARVLELGVFQGGMAFLLPSLDPKLQYVGVEWFSELPNVVAALQRRPDIDDRVHLLLGFSQDDPRLLHLVEERFPGQELDLIIDDASHRYGYTRRSFEHFFPLLRTAGHYIIEDWGWAHWSGFEPPPSWLGEASMSNLLFELCMVAASEPGIISSIEVDSAKYTVRRGSKPLPKDWKLEQSLNINGQSYSPLMIPSSPAIEKDPADATQ